MFDIQDYVNLLNNAEKESIRNADEEYVFFDVSVANVGAVARIQISNDLQDDWNDKIGADWNGYDAILYVEELKGYLED